jgi:hypothetical protein
MVDSNTEDKTSFESIREDLSQSLRNVKSCILAEYSFMLATTQKKRTSSYGVHNEVFTSSRYQVRILGTASGNGCGTSLYDSNPHRVQTLLTFNPRFGQIFSRSPVHLQAATDFSIK